MAFKVQGWSHTILKNVQLLLNLSTGKKLKTKGQWTRSLEQAAVSINKTSQNAPKTLQEHAKKFISTKKPSGNPYSTWIKACISADEEFAQEINLHIQSKGKYLKADDISVFLNTKDVQDKWGLKKSIGKATAKHWLRRLGYHWVKNHKGQYVDEHECKDVVDYHQNIYLPRWYELQSQMQTWENNRDEEPLNLAPEIKPVFPHFHNEFIYYANNRRHAQWVHEYTSATPYVKGEGSSMMTVQYFSPNHEYLCSPDGKEDS